MRRLLPIALVSIATAALAADDEVVRAPFIEPGDCWSYRVNKMDNRGPIDEYEECVTHIDWYKGIVVAVATLKDTGREIDTAYSTEWDTRTSVEGTIVTARKSNRAPIYPLRVGDTYEVEVEYRRAFVGSMVVEQTQTVRVVGWEDVTVPAGKFRALKIETTGHGRRLDDSLRFPFQSTSWYVPAVNRAVKYWYEDRTGRRGIEMTGYRLTK